MAFHAYRDPWSFAMGIGNYDHDDDVVDNGFAFTIYGSGPWGGVKQTKNSNLGWIGMNNVNFDLMVSRESCLNNFHILSLGLETHLLVSQ